MDIATQKAIEKLHPKIRQKVTDAVNEANSKLTSHSHIRIIQGLRAIEEQNALYAKGRTLPGPIVTKAKGGEDLQGPWIHLGR